MGGRKWPLLVTGAAVLALAALVIGGPTGASQPYSPTLEFLSISNSAPGANANITFRTSLPAGNHVLGSYILDTHWGVAGFSQQLKNKVAAIVTMDINLDDDGNCNDGDSGTPQSYGPAPLLYIDPNGGGAFHATWSGIVTDFGDMDPNTKWTITFTIDPAVSPYNFQIPAFMAVVTAPAGHTICTPQVFSLTMCGRANPTATATICGSGSDPVVMTNPSAAGCYTWELNSEDESSQHLLVRQTGVSIGGTPCPTPSPTPTTTATPTASATPTVTPTTTPTATPGADSDGDGVADGSDNCPRWWNPAQNLPPWVIAANDPDCDGFGTDLENYMGTLPFVQCGTNAWPPDTSNNTFNDTLDISALTSRFGLAVPAEAPARYNLAPDPPQPPPGYVDTLDIAKMTAVFGLTCGPCPSDLDCDVVVDGSDNCPSWPNPAQNLPPWFIPPNDPDCDGFSSALESYVGTNPSAHCGLNAWPSDTSNNGFVDTLDIADFTSRFGLAVPAQAPVRFDLAPDPPQAPPNFIDTLDIAKLTSVFSLGCG